MEQLINCKRCGSNACYEQQVSEEVKTWLCMGCGFTTSTVMIEGSEPIKNILETSPELYKDLMHTDADGCIWVPSTITLPNRGMVFLDGTSAKDWRWAAVKAVPLQESDKKLDENQTHKMDMKNVQYFNERDFMDALEAIGFFELL